LPVVRHGVTCTLKIRSASERLFNGLPDTFSVTQYHSWAVVPETVPEVLEVTAVNEDGIVMALAHRTWDVRGLQFHPESIMTEHGKKIMKNWLTQS
jgi:anthranilate synthase component 2